MYSYTFPVYCNGRWMVETDDGIIFVNDKEYREKHENRIKEYAIKKLNLKELKED